MSQTASTASTTAPNGNTSSLFSPMPSCLPDYPSSYRDSLDIPAPPLRRGRFRASNESQIRLGFDVGHGHRCFMAVSTMIGAHPIWGGVV